MFIRTHKTPLIIDEFQYAPNLLSYIKIAIDEARKNEMFGDGKEVGTLYYLTCLQIFETYIISEIVKSYTNNQRDPRKHLYYYRDNNQKEIDLLIVNEDNIYPVEIKKSANPGKDAIKNFKIVKKFEMNSPNGIVLCLTEKIHAIDENNYMVPIEYI